MAQWYGVILKDFAKCEKICTTFIGTKAVSKDHFLLLSDMDRNNPPATPRPYEQSMHAAYEL